MARAIRLFWRSIYDVREGEYARTYLMALYLLFVLFPVVQAALLRAARDGKIELQIESGINRLSPTELALCPEGLRHSRLSWARIIEEA